MGAVRALGPKAKEVGVLSIRPVRELVVAENDGLSLRRVDSLDRLMSLDPVLKTDTELFDSRVRFVVLNSPHDESAL